jgi:predicted TIM-barrel fold metal-dependent hydrolase
VIIDAIAHMYADPAVGRTPATPEVVIALMDDAGVDALVHATPFASGYDNSFSLAVAARYPDRFRVMACVDPLAADVSAQLESIWVDRNVVGVRLILGRDAAESVAGPVYERFWHGVSRLGIPVGIYLAGRNLGLVDVCAKHPDVKLMLNHIGMTYRAADPFEDWDALFDLVPLENVAIRVSAIPELTNEGPPFTRARELLREVVDRFGPSRVMWGSNFPEITRVCTYRESLDVVRECDFLTVADKDRVLGGNLVEFGDRSRWFGG